MIDPSAPIAAVHAQPRMGLQIVSNLGFRRVTISASQVGMRPRELDQSARRGLRAELRRLELMCDAVDLFIPPEHFEQSEHVDRALGAVHAALDLAGDLGAQVLFVRLPNQAVDQEPSEATGALLSLAEGSPVRIADVSLQGPAMKAHAAGDFVALGVGLDTAAWLADGRDPVEGVVSLGPALSGVRLVDLDETGTRSSVAPGGRVDVQALRIALETGATSGVVVADARGWAQPVQGLQETLAAWQMSGMSR